MTTSSHLQSTNASPADQGLVIDATYESLPDDSSSLTIRVNGPMLSSDNSVGLPVEVAALLGCSSGQDRVVTVINPAGHALITVGWQTSPTERTVLSGLSEVLRRIGAKDGDLVQLSTNQMRQLEICKLAPEVKATRARRKQSVAALAPTVRSHYLRRVVPDEQSSSRPDPSSVSRISGLEPWGSPPTPLLPSWYLDTHGEVELPAVFTDVYPQIRRLGDLRNFWEHHEGPLTLNEIWHLRDLASQLRPPGHLTVLGNGIGPAELDRLPLKIRTRNCVSRGLNSGAVAAGSVDELMNLPNFGIASLLDLMCVLEAYGSSSESVTDANESADNVSTESPITPEISPRRNIIGIGTGVTVNATRLLSEILPRWSLAIRSTALICDEAELVVAAARELRGARCLGDLLKLDLTDLIAAAEADSALAEIALEDDSPSLAERAIEAVEACLGRMSDTERLVVMERLVASEPKSLKEIAALAGLSRERIRQLDMRVRSALDAAAGSLLGLLSLAVTERLGYVTTHPEIENAVAEFLSCSSSNSDAIHSLIVTRRLLQNQLGYECHNGLCLSREASQAAETLKQAAQNLVDDAGLIDSEQLRQALDRELNGELEALVRWLGWQKLSEHLALRVTARAQTKAALLKIGKPATKAELAAESGLTEQQVGGALSSIESVARATKDRWGLREWIDDVYEGIPAEIIQRINEDGGSTRLNRLLDELPRKFGVSESSVWAYLNTPAFRVEHGYVMEAAEYDLQLGSLADLADGVTDEGDPFWTFEMMDRHLRGYSVHGVPPEVAVALGCAFGGSAKVSVRYPKDCQDISVIWRKTSMHGPEIGRLADALRALRFCDGTVVGLVIHKDKRVSLRAADDCRKHRQAVEIDTEQAFTCRPTANPAILQGVKVGPPISAHLNIKLQRTSYESKRVKVDDE